MTKLKNGLNLSIIYLQVTRGDANSTKFKIIIANFIIETIPAKRQIEFNLMSIEPPLIS